MRRSILLLPLLLLAGLIATPARAAGGTVNVFYAGALTTLNENLIGPAFAGASGYGYQGKAAGSVAIANLVKGRVAQPDVIELADPAVNHLLMGAANGGYVSWYFTFAHTQLVVGFDPRSKYAAAFRAVQKHHLAWYRALEQKGLRLGRTDPNLDPKGYRALFMAHLAQKVYRLHGFVHRVLGSATNPRQVFPEETLVARMLTGQIDAGIFYLSEVKDLGVPFIRLPARVNLGASKYTHLYATQHFTNAQGQRIVGAPILFTLTIPSTVQDHPGAEAYVRFMLSKRVRSIAVAHGLLPTKVTLHGSRSEVPAALLPLVGER
jgi:molybdate/tungstate transport system substrate-binding protein